MVHRSQQQHDINKTNQKVKSVVSARIPRTSSTRLRSNLLRKLGIPPSSSTSSSSSSPVSPRRSSVLGKIEIERIPLKKDDYDDDDGDDDSHRAQQQHQQAPHSCKPGDAVFQALGLSLWTRQQQQPHQQQRQQVAGSADSNKSHASHSTLSTAMSMEEEEDESEQSGCARHHHHVHFDATTAVVRIPARSQYSNRIRSFLWDSPVIMQRNIVRNTLEFTADGWDFQTVLEEDEHYFNPKTKEYIHPVHLEIAQMPLEEQAVLLPAHYVNPALVPVVEAPADHPAEEDTATAAAAAAAAEGGMMTTDSAPTSPTVKSAKTTMPHPNVTSSHSA